MSLLNRASRGAPEYIIAGLGNPGAEYELTRHNTGFRALDYISGKSGISVKKLKHMALTGKGDIGGVSVLLMKPQTYMNSSGEAIRDAANYYKIPPEKVVVIYDDTALPVGAVRIRKNGSDGGHNGIKSIIQNLNSQNFVHIRLGVGEKPNGYIQTDYVLGKTSPSDYSAISANFDNVFAAAELILNNNIEKAMSLYNKNINKTEQPNE